METKCCKECAGANVKGDKMSCFDLACECHSPKEDWETKFDQEFGEDPDGNSVLTMGQRVMVKPFISSLLARQKEKHKGENWRRGFIQGVKESEERFRKEKEEMIEELESNPEPKKLHPITNVQYFIEAKQCQLKKKYL